MSAKYGTGGNNTPLILETYPADSRIKIREDGIVQTLTQKMVKGGVDIPLVYEDLCRG